MKDQQIQTEIVETANKYVQAGCLTQQQGVCSVGFIDNLVGVCMYAHTKVKKIRTCNELLLEYIIRCTC